MHSRVDLVAVVAMVLLSSSLAVSAQPTGADRKRDTSRSAMPRAFGTLVALPPIADPGRSPASPPSGRQLVATFEPARPGRVVLLQRDTRRGWKTTASAVQDRLGAAAFDVRRGIYRATTTATAKDPATTTRRVRARSWRLSFEDEFSGRTLDGSVWNDQKREHESVYAPRTCARSDPLARRVAGGVLHLGIAPDPARVGVPCAYDHPAGSGTHDFLVYTQVATEFTHVFQHGIFAARMKLQRARGMHSAFWLLPQDRRFVFGDPSSGTEIDVVEFFGEQANARETIHTFVQHYDPGWLAVRSGGVFPRARRVLERGARWWEDFHVFSVEWTADAYVFRVDGREYYRETDAVSLAPQYLVLSMMAADFELDDLTADELDDTAEVDWVRVWDATSPTSR